MNERWSFVQSRRQPRWLWHAIDHHSGEVLASGLAPHEDMALSTLMELLTPLGIQPRFTPITGGLLSATRLPTAHDR
ncbi:MAG: IS1 family transposase [Cyanobacteria bacterium P01_H01_bin.153]